MQNLRRALLGLSVATLVVVGAACGGPFDDGVAAYKRGDYAIALQSYRKAADQGDARAQNNLGAMYENGQGVPQSYTEAIRWYRLAADQGDATAQNNLGSMYSYGRGVPQNYAEAMKWFRLAADQGDAKAQHNLGVMNESGQGVPQSYTEAMRWYRLAADQGYANAQNNLGSMYIYGRGVPQNYAEAMKWYRLAADQGNARAQVNLGIMYGKGQGTPKNYAEAMKWFRLAADRGDAQGQVDVGVCYRDGMGVPQDYTEAIKWFRLAANQGKASGQLDLGDMYREGHGVPQDYVEAGKWYRLAAVQGESKAQNALGVMYRDGQGVQQDYSEAVKWYRLAAEQGNAAAQVSLGAMYANGQGVAKDYVLAYLWFTLSATQGDEGVEQAVKNLSMLTPLMTPMQIAESCPAVGVPRPTGIAIDPADNRHAYLSVSGYARHWMVGPDDPGAHEGGKAIELGLRLDIGLGGHRRCAAGRRARGMTRRWAVCVGEKLTTLLSTRSIDFAASMTSTSRIVAWRPLRDTTQIAPLGTSEGRSTPIRVSSSSVSAARKMRSRPPGGTSPAASSITVPTRSWSKRRNSRSSTPATATRLSGRTPSLSRSGRVLIASGIPRWCHARPVRVRSPPQPTSRSHGASRRRP